MGLLPQLVNTKDRKPYCKASTKATKEHFQIVPISFNVDTQSNLISKLEDPKLLSVDYFEERFIPYLTNYQKYMMTYFSLVTTKVQLNSVSLKTYLKKIIKSKYFR